YLIVQVRQMIANLEGWIEQTEDTLDNAENADYPNDDRIETLQARIDALNEALDALNEIE
ncbi:MAG TPA: hypothetical protein VI958_10690, partial [Acidobacteriota bacterium]